MPPSWLRHKPPSSPVNIDVGIAGIDPDVVEIAVRVGHRAETAAAIHAQQQRAVHFEYFVLVLGIDDQVGEIERPPHLKLAGVQPRPVLPAVSRNGTARCSSIRCMA